MNLRHYLLKDVAQDAAAENGAIGALFHAAKVRRRVMGELKRLERQLVNARIMPDDSKTRLNR